jgi:hypothetical protein
MLKENYVAKYLLNSLYIAVGCGPRTSSSMHLMKLCRTSPILQQSVESLLLLKNGSTQTLAAEANRSSNIQVNRGPVSSMAGSAFISKIFIWNGFSVYAGLWSTTKSAPKSSKAFGSAYIQ